MPIHWDELFKDQSFGSTFTSNLHLEDLTIPRNKNLAKSLAKRRGPSENHICSFIAPSIPRSWQFGANLGGEGQKLPPPPKIAVSGEELAVVEMMQKVAVVVEMMHFFCKS